MLNALAPRWKKLLADLRAERGRIALMLTAVALSLAAIGAILGSHAILTHEIAANYLATRPAHATLEMPGGVDEATLALARSFPRIGVAEARDVLPARIEIEGRWRPLLLFVIEDFTRMQLATVKPVAGAWPPPRGTVLLERTAAELLHADVGSELRMKTAKGEPAAFKVSGIVHDPGLAPAWQEQTAYAYVARADLGLLGEPAVAHELRLLLDDERADRANIASVASGLASRLAATGRPVHEIRVPPPREHPHQRQMTTMLVLFLAFSVLALILSAILVANSIAAMLARQLREIGIMKTIGASSRDIAVLYGSMIALLGFVAALLAIPAGLHGAWALSSKVAMLLNLDLGAGRVPLWVIGVEALAGVALPLVFAFTALRSAALVTVSQSLARQGAGGARLRRFALRLPRAWRESLRRPARLALTVGLLGAAGAMFMTALNVSSSWEAMVAKVYQTRHYDFEVRLANALSADTLSHVALPAGIRTIEAWGYGPAAFARDGKVDVVARYPDRGHGSFSVLAPPPNTRLISLPIMAGRWLQTADSDAVVLNHSAAALRGNPQLGDRIELSIDGKLTDWTLVGVVEEIGAPAIAYVSDAALARVHAGGNTTRLLRISLDKGTSTAEVMEAMDRALASQGLAVESILPLTTLRTAMSGHIEVLIRSLLALALVMAAVGALGLASAMGTSVFERRRDFAIMKTLGATPRRIARGVIAEAWAIAGLSGLVALLLSLPLSALIDGIVGRLGFIAPLPFVVHPPAVVAWLLLLAVLAPLASFFAARSAAAPRVVEALAAV